MSLLAALRARIRLARFAATPAYARRTQLRTAVGRTGIPRRMRRASAAIRGSRAEEPAVAVPPARRLRVEGRNVLFVSHCDFTGQSAYHVYAIAAELERRGWSPAIAVPGRPIGIRDLGRPAFPVLSFRDVARGRLEFSDRRGPDLVHAWTPREPVRRLTLDVVRRHGCDYAVHLEDNEHAVRASIATAYSPLEMSAFLDGAAAMTVIVDRLLELKPEHVPAVVVWPGYDAAIERPLRPRTATRADVRLAPGSLAIVYPGNVHEANLGEVRSLYDAVGSLRAEGRDVVLVRSGLTSVPRSRLPRLGPGVRELGWIRRRRIFELLHAADVLVQPGGPGAFNDYRLPSKLPEFLASGRPVILPRTNIGLHLEDGVEALLLAEGGAGETREKIATLAADADLRGRLGERGRDFARRELRWSKAADRVLGLYERIGSGDRPVGAR